LKKRTTVTTTAATNSKHYAKPPRQQKIPQVDITFDENNFPSLPESLAKPTANNAAAPPPTVTAIPPTTPYDYKAEMDRISVVIENKLKHQFAGLFAQMEQRIEKLTQQQAASYAEQQKVNEKNTQQLAWVIDNMQLFSKTPIPVSTMPPHHRSAVMGSHNESGTNQPGTSSILPYQCIAPILYTPAHFESFNQRPIPNHPMGLYPQKYNHHNPSY